MLHQVIKSEISATQQPIVKIGSLNYDANNQCLYSNNETIHLRSKLNEVFKYLLINQQQLVSREELIEKVWHGNFYTGERGVTHSMCKLRRTISELGEKSVEIQTLPKKGYCLKIN